MNDASPPGSDQKTNYESPYIGLSPNLYREFPRSVARISSRITTVIRIVNTIEEIIAVLPSHSQFRRKIHLYLDLHGLVLETSIYHWQDQPGSLTAQRSTKKAEALSVWRSVFSQPTSSHNSSPHSISARRGVVFFHDLLEKDSVIQRRQPQTMGSSNNNNTQAQSSHQNPCCTANKHNTALQRAQCVSSRTESKTVLTSHLHACVRPPFVFRERLS